MSSWSEKLKFQNYINGLIFFFLQAWAQVNYVPKKAVYKWCGKKNNLNNKANEQSECIEGEIAVAQPETVS